ncbi:hypothetical protein E2P81_ATG06635 [Venturia nashicola]|nr:hypothetical protein E2P81_ATG06635 [Venturia nashicola]
MGCTSSKESSHPTPSKPIGGANNNNVNNDKDKDNSQPVKTVRTNFSDVNYTDPASGRGDTAYALSEVPEAQRPSVVSEVSSPLPAAGSPSGVGGAVSGDGVGNGVLGGGVIGKVDGEVGGRKEVMGEVPWDALSPGSTPRGGA